jgi:hypothetical protein
MKRIHSKQHATSILFLLPFLLIFLRRKIMYVCIFLAVISLSSCFRNFYRTNTKSSIDDSAITSLRSTKKYFIIHFPNIIKGLEQVSVSADSISGKLVALSPEHSKNFYPNPQNNKNRVKARYKKSALMEVHLYTNIDPKNNDSMYSASLSSFNRADVYELNRSATSINHVLSTIGVAIGGIYVIGAIVLVATCNCPQVYISDSGNYKFASGLYSGAFYSTLERKDYLPLTSLPGNVNDFSFKISNVKNEEQFINQVQLVQVNHVKGTNVLQDRYGHLLSYENTEPPLSALINTNVDIKGTVSQTDGKYYSFNDNRNKNGFSDLILKFNNRPGTDEAKLIIHARNSYWGGALHKEFINLFGDNFEKWKEKQEKADPKKLLKWETDQALPLMVYIKTAKGWKFVDYFPMIGNTASRDMIMEIHTADSKQQTIELKLETAYRFWDLDFIGIDYSANQNLTENVIEPLEAIKTDGSDQRERLKNTDKEYTHLIDEESIFFHYSIPPTSANTVSSYFLIGDGYYHNLEHITGKTNYSKLYKLRKKGAFDKFSRETYQQVQNNVATSIQN